MINLKPCPWCGGDDVAVHQWGDKNGQLTSRVACNDCRARGPIKNEKDAEHFADKDLEALSERDWNSRAHD